MNNRALTMPEHVAQLITLPLERLGLQPSDARDELISCPLHYEDGTVVSLVVICITKRGWFRERPALVISAMSMEGSTRTTRVHFRESMDYPTGPDDLPFTTRLSAKVRAIAWAIAATGGMGECISLPGRPPT